LTTIGEYELGPNDTNQGIYLGDAAELAEGLPDDSIDLIFTDPPYPREFMSVFYDMGEYAARILKPGGSLFTLCGHYQVPQVIEALSTLDYHWIGWMNHYGQKRSLFGYRIVCGGKPLLWFSKGKVTPFYGFWWDTISSGSRDKEYHIWGQPVQWAIPTLQQFKGVVLDPFCGGGTVPRACQMIQKEWLAFDNDEKAVTRARSRLRDAQPNLLVPTMEQQMMFLEEE
jgi:SAM-dependent methyltransferase